MAALSDPAGLVSDWLRPFSALFTRPTWRRVVVLVTGAILAPQRRTVTAALRAAGLEQMPGFARFHAVLNRACWSALAVSGVLLALLVTAFVPNGPVVIALDDTIERRWGAKIKARGIYRDPVRSSHGHFVKTSGLRWLSAMLLVPIPWAGRVWALPFLTALCPSKRYAAARGIRHKKLTDWAGQMLLQIVRWLPGRQIVVVSDHSFAALDLLDAVRRHVCMISRLRLDARLFAPAASRRPQAVGRPRRTGERLPTLKQRLADPQMPWRAITVAAWYGGGDRLVEIATGTGVWSHPGLPVVPLRWVLVRDPVGEFKPQAFLCTDTAADPADILTWFVRRWATEVTFAEARRHLGVETQRQWADKAIARTTPALLGLYSVIALAADDLNRQRSLTVRSTGWYHKDKPTFSDAIAAVRRQLWAEAALSMSPPDTDSAKVPRALFNRLADLVCYAA
jgi:hypothetical protein